MFDFVRSHVDLGGKREIVIDLASLESPQIEFKSLQVKDQVVWYVLQACSLDSVNVAIAC
jgi:hypothetical protein